MTKPYPYLPHRRLLSAELMTIPNDIPDEPLNRVPEESGVPRRPLSCTKKYHTCLSNHQIVQETCHLYLYIYIYKLLLQAFNRNKSLAARLSSKCPVHVPPQNSSTQPLQMPSRVAQWHVTTATRTVCFCLTRHRSSALWYTRHETWTSQQQLNEFQRMYAAFNA